VTPRLRTNLRAWESTPAAATPFKTPAEPALG
jgi:hypothetical protein